jgi:hypothetical protein
VLVVVVSWNWWRVRIVGNRIGDPDAMEIVTNTIGGNLA